MTFNNASAAPLLHILGHGIMYNVQSIMYIKCEAAAVCVKMGTGQGPVPSSRGRCRLYYGSVLSGPRSPDSGIVPSNTIRKYLGTQK